MWWDGDIYGTYAAYENSLSRFTREQRLALALLWYEAEVSNGGHHQFFYNGTGIVWEDALEASKAIGAAETQSILEEAAKRVGGSPSFDREERWEQLDQNEKGFVDLDDRFGEGANDLRPKLIQYMKDNRAAFHFDGTVRKPQS